MDVEASLIRSTRKLHPRLALAAGIVLLALPGALALNACGPRAEQPGKLDATIVSIAPAPPAVGEAVITLAVRDTDGNPLEGATIEVEGTMTHAGMKPVIVETEALGGGRYATKGFAFTMGGDWVIIVRARLADGTTAQQRVDLKGVRGEMQIDMKSDKAQEGN